MLTNQQRDDTPLGALLDIAQDLTASLAARDRYSRLLAAVQRLIPCDAACLLRLDGDDLVPVAGYGHTSHGSGPIGYRSRRLGGFICP